jgi:hypothetical protein
MAHRFEAKRVRRRAGLVAGVYLGVAMCALVYAWTNPGAYSLNFLLPFLFAAPVSFLLTWLLAAVGVHISGSVFIAIILASAAAQAGILYGLVYLSALDDSRS